MKLRSMAAIWGLGLAMLLCSGCGKGKIPGRPELFKVFGKVTFKEKPVEGATVVFVPQAHSHAAMGVTDAKGNFQLQTYAPEDGAAPGAYRVIVKKCFFDDDEVERQLLPPPYATPDESGLTADVEAGLNNNFCFDLAE
jgi:hypothetical protein